MKEIPLCPGWAGPDLFCFCFVCCFSFHAFQDQSPELDFFLSAVVRNIVSKQRSLDRLLDLVRGEAIIFFLLAVSGPWRKLPKTHCASLVPRLIARR